MVQQRTPTQPWRKSFFKSSITVVSTVVVLIGLTGGCAKIEPFKHNTVAVLPQGSLERDWFVDLDLGTDSVAKVDVRDKLVYLYMTSKRVVAFDRKAGTLALSMQVASPADRLLPVVELRDHLVFPNITSLEVFDTKGVFERSIPLPTPLRGNASGDINTVYFGSVGPHGGLVEAFDVSNLYAPQKWEFLTRDGADVTAGTAIRDGVMYSGSNSGEVDAVTAERAQLWNTDNGDFLTYGSITADLKVDETGLYVASKDTNLYCINRTTGKLKWQYFSGEPLSDAPVTTSDTLYQYVPGKGLAALDKVVGPFNRSPRWVHPTATQFLAQDDKYAYLADPRSTGYAIIAVDKQTMKQAFESDRKDYALLGTNRKDAIIYAAYEDGKIFAIKPVLKAGQIGELVMGPAVDSKAN